LKQEVVEHWLQRWCYAKPSCFVSRIFHGSRLMLVLLLLVVGEYWLLVVVLELVLLLKFSRKLEWVGGCALRCKGRPQLEGRKCPQLEG
jgi:hypothetical protein